MPKILNWIDLKGSIQFFIMFKNIPIISAIFFLFTLSVAGEAFCLDPAVESLFNQGLGYYRANNYQKALQEFDQVLALDPENESAKKYIEIIFTREIIEIREEAFKREMESKIAPYEESVCYGLTPEECIAYLHGLKGAQEDYRAAKFAVNSQVSAFTGDYGDPEGKNTMVTSFSETFKYIGKKGEISLGVPYLIRNGGGVTVGETSTAGARSIPKRADGIGDISLKGEYYWLDETAIFPSIDLNARVKFPLASHDRGLGTGRHDFATGISLLKRFNQFLMLLDLGLVVRQRPNNSTIKPLRLDFSPGFGYLFSRKFSAYLFVDSSTKTSKNDNKPLELIIACSYKPKRQYSLNAYLLFGLSRASPDVGVSTGITRYF